MLSKRAVNLMCEAAEIQTPEKQIATKDAQNVSKAIKRKLSLEEGVGVKQDLHKPSLKYRDGN